MHAKKKKNACNNEQIMDVCRRDNGILGKLAGWSVAFIDLEKGSQGGRWVLSCDVEMERELL